MRREAAMAKNLGVRGWRLMWFACRTSRHSAFHVHQQERMTQEDIKMSVTVEWRNSIQGENASEKGDVQPILPFSNERWDSERY